MASEMAERFMRTLQEMEQSGDTRAMVDLFDDQAELHRLTGDSNAAGRDGAQKFWQEYLTAFQQIRSRFTHVIESDGTAVMEWVSRAEPETAEPFEYEGVSIIEVNNGKVTRFRTYYDSARFVQTTAKNQ
jgi:ketosteroid isomerase-like protein